MASEQAIAAVGEGVVSLLRDSYVPDDFVGNDLEFKVATMAQGEARITAGVTVHLYRVFVNHADRSPVGRTLPDGRRARNQLPLDLHMLLTPWGGDASLRHLITGWMMRTLEDHPIMPAGLLNRNHSGAFRTDETVELAAGQIETEDLLALWDLFEESSYQLSVPYVASNVRIESKQFVDMGGPVQERTQAYRVPAGSS